MRPMEGMRVIALEHAVAAPLCTVQTGDKPGHDDFMGLES
jgi:crotonobetainyl-CoA:carnitine CoA-transferase CaiB-like acyl-CoA transferase